MKLEEKKQEFANAFIDAISTKSIEACKALVVSYEERKIMFGGVATDTPEGYDALLTKQCTGYFEESNVFLDEHKEEISTAAISNAEIHNLGIEIEIDENCRLQKIMMLEITMDNQQKDNYQFSNVSFQIEGVIIINGEIKINNFLITTQKESSGLDKEAINNDFNSQLCKVDTYENLLKDYPQLTLLESLQESDYIKLYFSDTTLEKDLSLEAYDQHHYSENGEGIFDAIFVLGSLTVKGNIYNASPNSGLTLYVEKDLTANNINTGGSLIRILNKVTVKNVCISNQKGYLKTQTINCSILYGESNWIDKLEGAEGRYKDEKMLSKIICKGGSADKETKVLLRESLVKVM